MSNDLQDMLRSYAALQDEFERVKRMVDAPYLALFEKMSQTAELARGQHLQVIRPDLLTGQASWFADVIEANKRWQDMARSLALSQAELASLRDAHRSWLDRTTLSLDGDAQFRAMAGLSASKMACQLAATEHMLAGIDFNFLRQRVLLPERALSKLEDVIGNLSSSYKTLSLSIRAAEELIRLPVFALPGATREVFTTGYALHTICAPSSATGPADAPEAQLVADAEQETLIYVELLRSVDPGMVVPYIGAHQALHSANPDRARHILSSLRELWTHVLHRLAPDDHVLAWVPSDRKDLLSDKGLPTRAARVLYICRGVNHKPLTDFVVADTHALVKLMESLNRVHGLDPGLDDDQLRALVLRSDSWLVYILQIGKEGQQL